LDSYIIRIYRRGLDSKTEIAGLIERIGNGKRQAFGSSEELWAFLTERHLARKKALKAKQSNRGQR
jgi:hypothetical protein